MDWYLTKYYRLICEDIILINDVIRIYKQKRSDPLTLKEFTESLSIVIQQESDDIIDATNNNHTINTYSIKNKIMINNINNSNNIKNNNIRNVCWEFFHSVVLQFSLEELSQYPFWTAKVVMTTNPKLTHLNLHAMIVAWFHVIKMKFQDDGIAGLYEGYIPFLAASLIQNYESFEYSLRHFFLAITSTPDNSPSTSLSSNMFSKGTRKHSQSDRLNNMTSKPSNQKSKIYSVGALFRRSLSTLLSHPFLCLSVAMISNSKLRGQNWVLSSLSILSTSGIRGLYSGLRTHLGFSLIPLSSLCFLGISETIIYRSMAWVGRSQNDKSGGLLSVGQSIVKNDGFAGLLQYGILTAIQIVPGFATFIATKSLLWLFLGSSRKRKKQLFRRYQILEMYWMTQARKTNTQTNQINDNKRILFTDADM